MIYYVMHGNNILYLEYIKRIKIERHNNILFLRLLDQFLSHVQTVRHEISFDVNYFYGI